MPPRANAAEAAVRRALRGAVPDGARLVLAVSGGRDSMVLLDAMARWHPRAIVAVASFDHGTGSAARDAIELVRAAARELEVTFVRGRATGLRPTEAAWRQARWGFLRDTAHTLDARVATAHSRDDQIETVFIRALRGAGARGLAGLYAPGDIERPLLGVTRAEIAAYGEARALPFVEDPSNASRVYLRNRVRLDVLPALERAQPGFGAALLDVARRAAAWRADVERRVDALSPRREGASVFVHAASLVAYEGDALAHLWPALAARAGIALDRRGTVRLAAFSTRRGRSGRVQLAGGHEVVRHPRAFEIRPAAAADASPEGEL